MSYLSIFRPGMGASCTIITNAFEEHFNLKYNITDYIEIANPQDRKWVNEMLDITLSMIILLNFKKFKLISDVNF